MGNSKIKKQNLKIDKKKSLRMCTICKERREKQNLCRISKIGNKYIYDNENIAQVRGAYVCKDLACIEKLSKNKRYNIDKEELLKIVNNIKKHKNSNKINFYIDIKKCVFGIKIVRDKIWKKEIKLVIIATDITEKNKDKIKKDCIQKNITYIVRENKERLGRIFGKNEISVIGILDENLAKSLIKSLGGVPVEST